LKLADLHAVLLVQDEYTSAEEPEYPSKNGKEPKKSNKKSDDEYDSYKEDEYKVSFEALVMGGRVVAEFKRPKHQKQ
jgi:hypothetical protein